MASKPIDIQMNNNRFSGILKNRIQTILKRILNKNMKIKPVLLAQD